jgi:integration host factor subunit alpha
LADAATFGIWIVIYLRPARPSRSFGAVVQPQWFFGPAMSNVDSDHLNGSAAAPGVDDSRTVTRLHLAEAVYRTVGLSRRESAQLVETFLETLCDTLVAGEAVKISSFGSFLVRAKAERIGRNPKTGVEVPITQRRVLVFKPSNVLKAAMKGVPAAPGRRRDPVSRS